jgi:hypothetical protein
VKSIVGVYFYLTKVIKIFLNAKRYIYYYELTRTNK